MGLPSMRPTGWFQVAWSADLEVGDVTPLHYFGAELVAFRDLDGAVRVLDAHCQHMGADLSHGGCVSSKEASNARSTAGCGAATDGHNVPHPVRAARRSTIRRVRCWPTAELNECIYVWHDLRHRSRSGPHPTPGAELDDRTRQPLVPSQSGPDEKQFFAGVTVHPQVVAESSVDRQHYRFVHMVPGQPDRRSLRRRDDLDAGTPRSASAPAILSKYVGMEVGLGFSCEDHGDGSADHLRSAPTPVDDTTTDIFATILGVRRPRLRRPIMPRPSGCWPTTSRSGPTCDTSTVQRWHRRRPTTSAHARNGRAGYPPRLSQTCAASPS